MNLFGQIKPVKAYCLKQDKVVKIDPILNSVGLVANFARSTEQQHKTGLLSPAPETINIYSLSVGWGPTRKHYELCLSDEQLAKCFKPFITPKKGQSFKVLKDTHGNDNCYNSPRRIDLPKGTVLHAENEYGTRIGDYFMKISNTEKVVNVYQGTTFHPYDVSHLDPDYFQLID